MQYLAIRPGTNSIAWLDHLGNKSMHMQHNNRGGWGTSCQHSINSMALNQYTHNPLSSKKMDPEGAIANGSIHLQWTEEDLRLVRGCFHYLQRLVSIIVLNYYSMFNMQIFAWLNNSIQAIDENLEDLWNQIADDFNENSLHEWRRQSIQCKRHWYKLNHRIVLFHSMWRRVRDLYINCRSSDELVSRALDLYKSETNKSFKDLNSWSVLRNEPHWNWINFPVRRQWYIIWYHSRRL